MANKTTMAANGAQIVSSNRGSANPNLGKMKTVIGDGKQAYFAPEKPKMTGFSENFKENTLLEVIVKLFKSNFS
jgi:hypothetical protein